jgi:protein-S-isoprenylcysteine O-methyltransferase Ste14
MGATLFRHRLAVIVGFFALSIVVAVVIARAAGDGATAGLQASTTLPSGLVCLLAFAVRTWGEARVGAAVYGQQASARLVTSGPFSLVRHPLYVGTWLFFVGATAPYLPVVVAAAFAVLFAAALRAIAVHEETGLEAAHGDAWRAYAARVPRLVGLPRRSEGPLAADGVVVRGADVAVAAVSNVGMLVLGAYRVAKGAGVDFVGLRSLTGLGLGAWFVVVVVRRLRRR